MAQFASLEEDNLFLINQKQEGEQALEEKNHEFERVKDIEISKLERNLEEIKYKQSKSESEESQLTTDNNVFEAKGLSPATFAKLQRKVWEIYTQTTRKSVSRSEPGKVLAMLSELEGILDQ